MAIRGFLTTLGLSRQEEQVLILSISGLADKEVAKELGIALETVRTYWQRIRRKVGGQTRAELVARLVSESAQKEIDEKASENERLVSEIARRKTAEQRFRAITDASPLGIFVTDPEGKCVYANAAWQTITGSTLIEAREGGWYINSHPEDLGLIQRTWEDYTSKAGDFAVEFRCMRQGKVVHASARAAAMKDGNSIFGFVGTIEDVTERTNYLSQLSSSEKRLNEAQRLANMGSWTWQGSDVSWSAGMYRVLEMDPKSKILTREECFAMIHPEDLAKAKEADRSARSGPGTYCCRYRVIVGLGIVKTLDWICTTEIANGKKLKFSGVLRDVSVQVATEAELARLASIIENSPDFISIRSSDGTIQYMNPTAKRIAKDCSDVLGPNSYYPAWAAKRVVEEGIPYALEHDVWVGESALLIDGNECPTSQLLISHRDSNGRNERISTIVRDIGPQKRLELELRQSEEKLRKERDFNSAVRETAGSLIVVLDPGGIIHSFNSECSKLSGLDNSKAIGSTYLDLLVPSEQCEEVGQIFESVRSDGILREHEHWWLTDSIIGGERRLVSWRTTAVPGHPGWIVTTGLDITEKRAAEQAQRETETRLQRVAESMCEALIVQLADGRITVFNPAAEAILMATADQMMGKASPAPSLKFVREDGTTFPVAEYPPVLALKTGVAQRNVVKGIVRADGSLRWCVVNSVPLLRESDGKPYAVVTTFFDATELKDTQSKLDSQLLRLNEARTRLEAQQSELEKANAMLRDLADSDPLTGLKNRRFLLEYLENEIVQAERYEQPVSLMMIDVDDFKRHNDVYGHAKGDEILLTLGTILVQGSRKSDRICRFGGDEFVIVLSRADEESSLRGAERIRSGVENHEWAMGEEITVSIGLVTYGGDLKSSSDLLSAADVAMRTSKTSGRNRVTHWNDLRQF